MSIHIHAIDTEYDKNQLTRSNTKKWNLVKWNVHYATVGLLDAMLTHDVRHVEMV